MKVQHLQPADTLAIRERVLRYIAREGLLDASSRVVLAVSGGLDSMVMLSIFHHANRWPFVVAHCNFTLRGEASELDETLVRQTCAKMGVACHVQRFETVAWAKAQGVSIEVAARELRYQWFETLRQSLGYTHIATAHHAQDQAETILFNLFRGAGLRGIAGIPPINGHVVRPLLATAHQEVIAWAEALGVPHREDATNATDDYTRNRIRHHLIPLSEQVHSAAVANSCRCAAIARESYNTLRTEAERAWGAIPQANTPYGFRFDWQAAVREGREGLARFWLRESLVNLGLSHGAIDNILESLRHMGTGRYVEGGGWRCTVDRDGLDVRRNDVAPQAVTGVLVPGETMWLRPDIRVRWEGCAGWRAQGEWRSYVNRGPWCAVLDGSLARGQVRIRRWQAGDRLRPLGMRRSKLVSDLLTDAKWPSGAREAVEVVEIGGKIAWVVGVRISEEFSLRPESVEAVEIAVLQPGGLSDMNINYPLPSEQ